jgi:hypothetical protein
MAKLSFGLRAALANDSGDAASYRVRFELDRPKN